MDASGQSAPHTPQQEYEARRDKLRADFKLLDERDRRLATARGLVFLGGCVLAYFAWAEGSISAFWLLAPIAFFAGLVVTHSKVATRLDYVRRAINYYERGLDRLADRWSGVGPSGQRYEDHSHAYSSDLDVFGEGSLFQLICGSRTRLGEDVLASWLKAPAAPDVVRARHTAIIELRNQLEFREDLAVLDAEVHDEFDQNKLREWVREPAQPFTSGQRISAAVLGVLAVCALIFWVTGGSVSPFLAVLILEIFFYLRLVKEIRHVEMAAERAGSGLTILGQVMEHLERQQFRGDYLASRRAVLNVEGQPPSARIHHLRNLIQNLSACLQNQFFAPIAFLLGLPVYLAHRVETWREHIGPHIPEWLMAVGEIEAVTSLSGYAFERPNDVFPELILDAGPALVGRDVGHPLLPDAKCIRNDVRLDTQQTLLMISGSNMSGKSTYLRTIGINAVLAWSGAPVRATRFQISPLQVGTEMRIHDSLQQGVSLFYSVISRLKAVVELAGHSPPLLFLLDEILQGTNSHDRRVGAEGIIRQLIGRGAIGVVTTHDLALTRIVESFNDRAANMHFEDHLINGKMYFDHRIRPGVVQKSNALELMRMIGLDVGESAPSAALD